MKMIFYVTVLRTTVVQKHIHYFTMILAPITQERINLSILVHNDGHTVILFSLVIKQRNVLPSLHEMNWCSSQPECALSFTLLVSHLVVYFTFTVSFCTINLSACNLNSNGLLELLMKIRDGSELLNVDISS